MQAVRKDLGVCGCDCKSECLQGIMAMLKDFIFDSKRETGNFFSVKTFHKRPQKIAEGKVMNYIRIILIPTTCVDT